MLNTFEQNRTTESAKTTILSTCYASPVTLTEGLAPGLYACGAKHVERLSMLYVREHYWTFTVSCSARR